MVQALLGSVGSKPSGGFGGINEEEGPHNVLPQIEHASTLVDRERNGGGGPVVEHAWFSGEEHEINASFR